ncbi:calcium/sodium antiporter [Myxococcota bacterium]|nr:calcium/sodium antiporter [Myxococcota bacterium]
MALNVVFLVAGIALLYFGAEWLIRGASGLARAFGLSPLVIGLTVVAYGTSMPELVVSMLAALEHKSAIALGNVVGSNIANLGLILGVTALIKPPVVDGSLIRREVPVMLATSFVVIAVLLDGTISRAEGALLVVGALVFTWVTLKSAQGPKADVALNAELVEETEQGVAHGSKPKLVAIALAGLGGLVLGGKLFVDGAVGLALAAGISERVVGLTIVAIGTSMPELATSVLAAVRGHSSIAVGNVVGSNIFNVLLILGASAIGYPIAGDLVAMQLDLGALVAISLLAVLFLRGSRTMPRFEGAVLIAFYAIFLGLLVQG